MTDKKDVLNDNQAAWWQPAMIVLAKLSGWIAVPIIAALNLGKWLDKKYDSAPRSLLICIGFAFLVSMMGLVKESVVELKKINSVIIEFKKVDNGGEFKKVDNLYKSWPIDKKL